MSDSRPLIRLNPGAGKRLRAGAPWVFSNEIAMQPEHRRLPRGGLVRLEGNDGTRRGWRRRSRCASLCATQSITASCTPRPTSWPA